MRSYGGLLEPSGQTLHRWNLRLMPNISCADCPGLSGMVSAQFILKVCIAAENRWKFTKTPYFWGSRSFKVIDVGTAGKLVGSACYDKSKSVSICNRFHARWANSGKITKGGTRLWCSRSRGVSSPSGIKLPHKKLDTLGYHMVKTRRLYLTWHWIRTGSCQTDGQTDGQNSHS